MRILALNPFHSGSHRSFLEGWISQSEHDFTLLTLPGRHWKWRMRHAPLTFSKQVRELTEKGEHWDLLFSTDMLHLPEFLSFAPDEIQKLPSIIYFHENQFTYPSQSDEKRDFHFAYSNFLTALKADQVWFNSGFHRNEFLNTLDQFLPTMPDFPHLESIEIIRNKSLIQSPGVEIKPKNESSFNKEFHILWSARWEHDKNPEDFFKALSHFKEQGIPFQLSVTGESYREKPACFEIAKKQFSEEIVHWGYQQSREDYERVLSEADVVVSTANHEFFGISLVEAVLAGCFPIVPDRLAYPDVFKNHPDFFYDGTIDGLTRSLVDLSRRHQSGNLWSPENLEQKELLNRFLWSSRSHEMDSACLKLIAKD